MFLPLVRTPTHVHQFLLAAELTDEHVLPVGAARQGDVQAPVGDLVRVIGQKLVEGCAEVFDELEAGAERAERARAGLKGELQRECRALACTAHNTSNLRLQY